MSCLILEVVEICRYCRLRKQEITVEVILFEYSRRVLLSFKFIISTRHAMEALRISKKLKSIVTRVRSPGHVCNMRHFCKKNEFGVKST